MAILVEAISVIIKCKAIEREFADWDSFVKFVPHSILLADDEIAGIMFMTPDDVKDFITRLENRGIKFLEGGKSIEIAVADQINGLTTNCDWIEFGHIQLEGKYKIAACRLAGSNLTKILMPDEWEYEKSLSSQICYVLPERLDKSFRFLRHENGLDVYLNLTTGKEIFIARPE